MISVMGYGFQGQGQGAWSKEQKVTIEDGHISAYRVNMRPHE